MICEHCGRETNGREHWPQGGYCVLAPIDAPSEPQARTPAVASARPAPQPERGGPIGSIEERRAYWKPVIDGLTEGQPERGGESAKCEHAGSSHDHAGATGRCALCDCKAFTAWQRGRLDPAEVPALREAISDLRTYIGLADNEIAHGDEVTRDIRRARDFLATAKQIADKVLAAASEASKAKDSPQPSLTPDAGRETQEADALFEKIEGAIRLAAQLGDDAFDFIEGRGLAATRREILAQLRGGESERCISPAAPTTTTPRAPTEEA